MVSLGLVAQVATAPPDAATVTSSLAEATQAAVDGVTVDFLVPGSPAAAPPVVFSFQAGGNRCGCSCLGLVLFSLSDSLQRPSVLLGHGPAGHLKASGSGQWAKWAASGGHAWTTRVTPAPRLVVHFEKG